MAVGYEARTHEFAAAEVVPAFRRLRYALAASVLLHAWIAAVLLDGAEWPGAVSRTGPALTVVLSARSELRDDPAPRRAVPDPAVADTVAPPPGTHASAPSFRPAVPDPSPRRGGGHTSLAPAGGETMAAAAARPPRTADPTYYPARELDVFPVPRDTLRFGYPERAASENVSGTVLATMLIDEAGTVESVSLERAEPAGYFEDVVRDVLGAATFSPGLRNGRAVKSRVLLRVEFDSGSMAGTAR